MRSTNENIKRLRISKGYSQDELAKLIGYTDRSSIAKIENGGVDLPESKIAAFAKVFGVSPAELMGFTAEYTPVEKATLRIPVYGKVPAGIPMEAIDDVVDWEEIPAAMESGGRAYFAVQVSGDSMYPDFLDGDTVIVRKQAVCQSGDVCVVYVNGYDATLKQVKIDERTGNLTIVPRNPSYPPRTYTRSEVVQLPVSIAGVVVELRRKIH